MSKDFRTSIWEVGTWALVSDFRAYHASNKKFYLRELNLDEISEEFEVSVIAINNECNLLICGLFSGVI